MTSGPVTSRLVLRGWRSSDREPFAAVCADPEVMRYFPAVLDRAASDALAARASAQVDECGYGLWAVELAVSGEFIGFIGLAPVPAGVPGHGGLEIGWRLAKEHWGRGYATEGARAALDIAFEELAVPEVHSFTAIGNLRSRRVMERLGMERVGEFDHPSVPVGSPLRRHVLYRITAPMWAARAAEERSDPSSDVRRRPRPS